MFSPQRWGTHEALQRKSMARQNSSCRCNFLSIEYDTISLNEHFKQFASVNLLQWRMYSSNSPLLLGTGCTVAEIPTKATVQRWGTNMATATPSWQTRIIAPRKLWRSEDPTPPPHWRSQVNLAEAQLRRPWRQEQAGGAPIATARQIHRKKRGFSVSCTTNSMSFSVLCNSLCNFVPSSKASFSFLYLHLRNKQCHFIFSFAFFICEWYSIFKIYKNYQAKSKC